MPSRDSAPRARAVEAAVSRHRPECIVIMPMYAGFEDVRASVAAAVDRAGFEMRRLEEEIEDTAWHAWLLDSAEAPDVVLADVTNHSPFVMYELGTCIAVECRKC